MDSKLYGPLFEAAAESIKEMEKRNYVYQHLAMVNDNTGFPPGTAMFHKRVIVDNKRAFTIRVGICDLHQYHLPFKYCLDFKTSIATDNGRYDISVGQNGGAIDFQEVEDSFMKVFEAFGQHFIE